MSTWVFAMMIMIPWAVFYTQIPFGNLHVCYPAWPDAETEKAFFLGAIFLCCYTIPLLLIMLCYILIGFRVWNRDSPGLCDRSKTIMKSKIKVVKMLVLVVLLFALSWLPMYIIRLHSYFSPKTRDIKWLNEIVMPIVQWLGLANSGTNPIIYCFYSNKFQRGFKAMVMCQKSMYYQSQDRRGMTTKYMTVEYASGQVTMSLKRKSTNSKNSL